MLYVEVHACSIFLAGNWSGVCTRACVCVGNEESKEYRWRAAGPVRKRGAAGYGWDTGVGRVGRKGMARWFALSTCVPRPRRWCATGRRRPPAGWLSSRLLDTRGREA